MSRDLKFNVLFLNLTKIPFIVYHRQVILKDIPGPYAAKHAPNGDPLTCFSFWDFNSLYLYSQDQDLPLGPGVLWEKNGAWFNKTMMDRSVSRGQIEWLMWLQQTDL